MVENDLRAALGVIDFDGYEWTDDECDAIDALHKIADSGPCVPVSELTAALGLDQADEEGILPGSAADQCAAIYELLARYGVKIA